MANRRATGKLRKLPSKKWQASYVGPNGVRYSGPTTYTRKMDGEAWLAAEQRLIERRDWTPPPTRAPDVPPPVHTLADVWGRFQTLRATPLARSTLTGYQDDWRIRGEPHWGAGRDITTITNDEVWAWRRGELAKERRRDRSALSLFSTLLKRAVTWDWLDKNPADGVTIPAARKAAAKRPFLDLDETRAYLEAAEANHVALLATVALGGLRSGEVPGLRWADVDLDGKRLVVAQAVEYGRDDTGARALGVKEPKTDAGARTLPISGLLVGILTAHRERHPGDGDHLVFPSAGGRPMGLSGPDRMHRQALANMGRRVSDAERRRVERANKGRPAAKRVPVPHDPPGLPTLHDMRASYAAWLMAEGWSITDVMALLGWSDSRMALEIYARATPKTVGSVGARQDEALAGLAVTVT